MCSPGLLVAQKLSTGKTYSFWWWLPESQVSLPLCFWACSGSQAGGWLCLPRHQQSPVSPAASSHFLPASVGPSASAGTGSAASSELTHRGGLGAGAPHPD